MHFIYQQSLHNYTPEFSLLPELDEGVLLTPPGGGPPGLLWREAGDLLCERVGVSSLCLSPVPILELEGGRAPCLMVGG